MNEKLRKIVNHYGINKQLKYFQSEIFELTEAVLDAEKQSASELFIDACYSVTKTLASILKLDVSGYKDIKRDHIKEEIADVMVMLKQIQLYYNIPTNEVKEVMKSKIDRQIERIHNDIDV